VADSLWLTTDKAGRLGGPPKRAGGRSRARVLAFRQGRDIVFEHLVPGSRLVVRDITGRLVQDSRPLRSTAWRWDVSAVPDGVYCYSAASPDGSRERGKVVVLNR
jgi:hypothetical protein